ncbi:hypothetical protein [Azospirillum baldaniorum]|uniref:hypothetical protein n=1 Tax=Azospirillum baldaniorum TaxID=1064539 RepID=UPI00157A6930|nr:hypothetical protein [Azospirillum baldaniorum]
MYQNERKKASLQFHLPDVQESIHGPTKRCERGGSSHSLLANFRCSSTLRRQKNKCRPIHSIPFDDADGKQLFKLSRESKKYHRETKYAGISKQEKILDAEAANGVGSRYKEKRRARPAPPRRVFFVPEPHEKGDFYERLADS